MEAFHAVKDTCRIVLLSTPHKDDFERLYDSHLPCASSPWHHKLRELAGCARDKLIVLDAVFADENQEIKDTYLFRQA